MPKVSVIIPVYNTAPWLRECLDSVLNQTLGDLEIICVNDASTDASGAILADYAQRDERLQIVTHPHNEGLAASRNTGLERARGAYIYFLDSDDSIVPDAMERLYRRADAAKLDVVYFDANPIFESEELKKKFGTYLFTRKLNGCTERVYPGEELFALFLKNEEWSSSVPRQFYSAEFLRQNALRFYKGILHEDELFSFRCILTAQRTMFLRDRFFNRRFRAGSIMTVETSAKHFCGLLSAAYYMNQYAWQNGLNSAQVRSYLAKMNNRAIALYEKHQADVCGEMEKLRNPELTAALYQFIAMQESWRAYGDVSENLVQRLRRYDRIYLYGAGVVAKSVYAGLVKKGFAIDGFVVTKAEGNPKVLEGHRVYDLETFSAFPEKEKTVVVIAVKNGIEEIHEMLERVPVVSLGYRE